MTERVKAERLRSACFRFLSRTGRYDRCGPGERAAPGGALDPAREEPS